MLFWLFWQFYNTTISADEFSKLFSRDLYKTFYYIINSCRLAGLLKRKGDNFVLTDRGIYLFHLIEQEYTHTYLNKTWATCMQEAWPDELILS